MKIIQTRQCLADKYGVHRQTISKWLKQAGIDHRGGLKPLDVERFIQYVGTPINSETLFKQNA